MNLLCLATFLISTVTAAPSASIKDGLVLGSTSNAVDTFLGIPFADPPTGNLRLRRPNPLSIPFGNFNATSTPRACPQKISMGDIPILKSFPEEIGNLYSQFNSTFSDISEDCLTLTVQRPANVSVDAKLPVLVSIYGGGFMAGAISGFDYTQFVAKSIELAEPVILVAMNYRVGPFGFLGGKELMAEGNTNLGLRDQRLALEWVHENIGAFGGDAEKVTIWGQSAGAGSVYAHLLVNGGNNTSNRTGKPLFRAGIMNSGTSFPAESVDGSTAQSRYDELVLAIGCNSSSLSASSLECLRNAPLERIVDATESLPKLIGPQGYYMSYVPRPDISNASDAFFSTYEFGPEQGIADVPIIVGGQEDECTLFAIVSDKVTTPAALIYQLQAQYPSTPVSVLEKFVSYYHGDAETGAPFRTDASQEAYPHSKINSAVVTDLVFAFQTRAFLAKITGSGSSPAVCPYKSGVWVYQGSYNHGLPFLGSYHGGDELLVGSGKPEGPYNDTVGSYIRFVGTGAPGSLTGGFEWPTYGESANVLRFNADGNEVIRDDSRKEAFDYFLIVQEQILF